MKQTKKKHKNYIKNHRKKTEEKKMVNTKIYKIVLIKKKKRG